MSGKSIRLSRILNPTTKRTCIVPMDHCVTMGPVPGLIKMMDTLQDVISGGADAVILHKGMFEQLANYPQLTRLNSFILHLSASTGLSKEVNHKCLISTVEQALKLGADGVSVHVNLGDAGEREMLADMGIVSDACMEWGVPLLAMMYVIGDKEYSRKKESIAHAARVAEEMGADLVKVNCPEFAEEIRYVAECVNIPVVVSGGPKMLTCDVIAQTKKVLDEGAGGISIGRNIFQSKDPELMTRILYGLVHEKITLADAQRMYSSDCESNKKTMNRRENAEWTGEKFVTK